MAYVIEKKIPVAMQERIFRETQQARNSVGTGYWLDDEDFLEYIQCKYVLFTINYELGNYLMRLRSEGDCEPLRSRYLFYYNNCCYLFYTDGITSNELIFFQKQSRRLNKLNYFRQN